MRPSLAALQAAFQDAVLAEDEGADVFAHFGAPPRGDIANFAAYRDGYRLRLAEFLANDFPVLREHMGDEDFGALVEDYVAGNPSRFRNARWFGAALPEFMAESPRWRDDAVSRDVARFERALADAFDAADAVALGGEALRDLPESDWPRLIVAFAPSLRLLKLCAEAQAVVLGETFDAATTVAVWRADEVLFRELDADEGMVLAEAMAGAAFENLCGLLAFRGSKNVALRAGALLSDWFAQGWVVALSLAK